MWSSLTCHALFDFCVCQSKSLSDVGAASVDAPVPRPVLSENTLGEGRRCVSRAGAMEYEMGWFLCDWSSGPLLASLAASMLATSSASPPPCLPSPCPSSTCLLPGPSAWPPPLSPKLVIPWAPTEDHICPLLCSPILLIPWHPLEQQQGSERDLRGPVQSSSPSSHLSHACSSRYIGFHPNPGIP